MNRRERDRDGYGRYEGYDREDEHYHSARNLTDEFERDYQHHRGSHDNDRDSYRPDRSYHEGDMGDAYERYRSDRGGFRKNYNQDRNRDYSGSYSRDRNQQHNDRPLRSGSAGQYNPYNSDNYSRTREQQDYSRGSGSDQSSSRYSGRDYSSGTSSSGRFSADYNREKDRQSVGNLHQGYGISDYDSTSDRYTTSGGDSNRRYGRDQSSYSGSGDRGRSARYTGSSTGGSSTSSERGIPNYEGRSYSGDAGSGLGDGYRGSRYGGNSAYPGGQQGGSYGRSSGSTLGNYRPGNAGSYGRDRSRDDESDYTSGDSYRRFVE